MKIVINQCFGGYGLSPKALAEIAKRKGKTAHFFLYKDGYEPIPLKDGWKHGLVFVFDDPNPPKKDNNWFHKHSLMADKWDRDDPDLVAVVEQLRKEANGQCAELEVVEIPDGVDWEIQEYDGKEWVAEKHRTWS